MEIKQHLIIFLFLLSLSCSAQKEVLFDFKTTQNIHRVFEEENLTLVNEKQRDIDLSIEHFLPYNREIDKPYKITEYSYKRTDLYFPLSLYVFYFKDEKQANHYIQVMTFNMAEAEKKEQYLLNSWHIGHKGNIVYLVDIETSHANKDGSTAFTYIDYEYLNRLAQKIKGCGILDFKRL